MKKLIFILVIFLTSCTKHYYVDTYRLYDCNTIDSIEYTTIYTSLTGVRNPIINYVNEQPYIWFPDTTIVGYCGNKLLKRDTLE